MRAVLALLLVLTSGQAFAVCATSSIDGTWMLATGDRYCTLYNVVNGRGQGPCNINQDGVILGQETFGIAIGLTSDCAVHGLIKSQAIFGTSNSDVTMITGGVAGYGVFIMTRQTAN